MVVAATVPAYTMVAYTNMERNCNARIVEVESSFRAAVEKSRIGVLLVSLDGYILQANRSFCDFLQYPEKELAPTVLRASAATSSACCFATAARSRQSGAVTS